MRDLNQAVSLIFCRARGVILSFFSKKGNFRFIGKNFKFYGRRYFIFSDLSVGDNCWFQAIDFYKGINYRPKISIGERCMFSNNVHISSVESVVIGRDSLFGSNIYVGDHSHGSTNKEDVDLNVAPALRPLADVAPIIIGERVWIGDGVVILAGAEIGDGSIVAANSVVKGIFPGATVIAGVPAKSVKFLS